MLRSTDINAPNSSPALTQPTISGNLTFTGTSNRIFGDFSNSTESNRLLFQNSVANSPTFVGAIPSGTGAVAAWRAVSNSNPLDASWLQMGVSDGIFSLIESGKNGAGVAMPLYFRIDGVDQLRLTAGGAFFNNHLGFLLAGTRITGDWSLNSTAALFQNANLTQNTFVGTIPNPSGGIQSGFVAYSNATIATAAYGSFSTLASTAVIINSAHQGGGATLPIRFAIDGTYISEITTAGNFLFGTVTPTGGNERVQINGALGINSDELIHTYTAFANGAGVQTGTLTNAPVAGNPTKWIRIIDSGVARYLPAW